MKHIKMQYVCYEPFWRFKKVSDFKSNCSVCQKNIIDFRELSESQIEEFKRSNSKNICGIFSDNQVVIDSNTKYSKSTTNLVLASFISFFTITNTSLYAQTQAKDSLKTEQSLLKKADTLIIQSEFKSVEPNSNLNKKSENNALNQKKRKRNFLGIYLDSSFPFIHRIKKNWVGTPSFIW